MNFEGARSKLFIPVAKVLALGAIGAGAYFVADRINASDAQTFNPDKPVEVTRRYHNRPGDWRLELEQCGFSPLMPEADADGCYQEQRDVTRRQYLANPVGSTLRLEEL